MFPMLSTIIFLPLLGGIVVLLLPRERVNVIRWTALGVAWLDLLLALGVLLAYAQPHPTVITVGTVPVVVGEASPTVASVTFLLQEHLSWLPALGINYSLGVDGVSVLLMTLTTLLTVVCLAASFRVEQKLRTYLAFMLLLESGLLGVFLATNLFLFYIFWELMLIPAYFLVGGWGGPRRVYAAIKFVLYTAVGSLLMLAAIIALGYYYRTGGHYTLDLAAMINSSTRLSSTVQLWLFLAFAAAFAVKVPLVPFHSWLPDAYSEAPAPVTAMLSGAMAKAGAFGFLRYCLTLFPDAAHRLAPLINTLAVIGILYCALLALVQSDMKRLLAYSSISHLGVITLGIFALNAQGVASQQGIDGAVLQMVNHGITITALFLIVGFLEARTGTRRLEDYGGMARRWPIMASVLMIASLSSLGLPGLNSFAGEFLTLLGVFRTNAVFGVLGTLVVVPAAWYMVRLVQNAMMGVRPAGGPLLAAERKGGLPDLDIGEFLVLLPLLVLIFYIGVHPLPLTFFVEH
uniref:NADH:ubiquinone oxidoreductase subunit M n=1 Tax=Thermogemmatispora argillosa TaxID=2045280 RepID=A0A455T249_9CHLR|nr:NADH:ubiquinone oxidoreductase subunit M [Thermogemmatispora argillosa]